MFTVILLVWKSQSRPDSKLLALSFVPIQRNYRITEYMQSIYWADLKILSGLTVTEEEVDNFILLREP